MDPPNQVLIREGAQDRLTVSIFSQIPTSKVPTADIKRYQVVTVEQISGWLLLKSPKRPYDRQEKDIYLGAYSTAWIRITLGLYLKASEKVTL